VVTNRRESFRDFVGWRMTTLGAIRKVPGEMPRQTYFEGLSDRITGCSFSCTLGSQTAELHTICSTSEGLKPLIPHNRAGWTPVFKTACFNRSHIPPHEPIAVSLYDDPASGVSRRS
jgi:hypothetical protein